MPPQKKDPGGRGGGTEGAQFRTNIAPLNRLVIKRIFARGGAQFFAFNAIGRGRKSAITVAAAKASSASTERLVKHKEKKSQRFSRPKVF